MDCYINAQETEQAAIALFDAKIYRQSVYMSCLATELYLKSRLYLVSYDEGLQVSHDIVNIYKALRMRYKPQTNFDRMIPLCRKYFNESRYPYAADTTVYTEAFAKEFIQFIGDVKDYVDNECLSTVDDLMGKYAKDE